MKKVLIISYYWPPSGGSGVQRWLKFAKYLPENNWQPIIFTPENPYSEIYDEDLAKEISSNLEIWKSKVWEPYTLKDKIFGKSTNSQSSGVISKSVKNKLLNWIRGNLFIPDPKIYWVKPSIRLLYKKIKNKDIKHIITTGPPHSMHLIGLGLKKLIPNLNWLADFRDPWSELDLLDEFYLSNYSRKKHQSMERKVLQHADVVLTVSETWMKDLYRLGASRVELIPNGYDDTDFDFDANRNKANDRFIIGHYGLLSHLRNPHYLWKELNCLCEENPNFNDRLEIHLSGNIDNTVINEIKSYTYLEHKVKNLGYLSHRRVVSEYNKASVLLLLLFNSKSGLGNYPGKIFEYFAVKKPILAFGPSSSDAEFLIKKTDSGMYFSYDERRVKNHILKLFNQKHNLKFNDIENFTRRKLTKDLSNLLESIS